MKTKLHKLMPFALFLLLPAFLIAQVVPRDMVVMEIGTGTWCTYCPGAAMGADDLLENGCKVAVIENHNGDAFANQYSNARNSFYGISGYPTAIFDGVSAVVGGSHTNSMYGTYLPKYNARIVVPANIQLSIDVTHTGLDYTAVITVTKVGTLVPTSFKLHFAVTVSNIQINWQGQTHLEHVNALMVPDQNGTDISFAGGDTQIVTLNYSLDPQWPVEDCEFIAFVQDATTSKEIFNGIKRGAIDLTPDFTASETEIIKNQSVTFTNGTTGGYIGVPESFTWTFPGGTPESSTDRDPVVTYSQVGTYDVMLVVDRGSQIDTLVKPGYITVNAPVGIDNRIHNDFEIFPNPSHGSFTITSDRTYDVQIINILGSTVYERANITGTGKFNLKVPAGSYFVSIRSGSDKIIRKLLIR